MIADNLLIIAMALGKRVLARPFAGRPPMRTYFQFSPNYEVINACVSAGQEVYNIVVAFAGN